MLPRTGRTSRVDVIEAHVEGPPFQASPAQAPESSRFDKTPPASSEALVRAFHDSSAMDALREANMPSKFVRMQSRQRRNDPVNPNILPMKAIREECVVDQHFLGDLAVESQVKTGEFVDRLGNAFDVWESELPPPDKDYRSTAASTSHRNLERCQGGSAYFDDRPKKEVRHVTNPAEPRGDGQRQATRQSTMELGGRQTFFNQAGTQRMADLDTGRDAYDGYNVRAPNEKRVVPLEPCWRATLTREHVGGGTAPVEGNALDATVPSKRAEVGAAFQRRPAVSAAAASHVRAFPIVSDATLRCQWSAGPRNGHGNDAGTARPDADHAGRPDAAAPVPTKPAMESLRRANPAMVPREGDRPMPNPANAGGPQQFATAPANEMRDLHRENGMIAPAPSKEPDAARRIAEAVERDAEDDKEVAQLTAVHTATVSHAAPRGAVDQHGTDVKQYTAMVPQHAIDAAPTHAQETTRFGQDATAYNQARLEHAVPRSHPREVVTANGTDVRAVRAERTDAVVLSSAHHAEQCILDNDRQQHGRQGQAQRAVGRTIRHEPTLSAERPIGEARPRAHRAYGGRTGADHDSLPFADRAYVAIHGFHDRPNGAQIAPGFSPLQPETWSDHYGLASADTSRRVAMDEDGVGRIAFGTVEPHKPAGATSRAAPRPTPLERSTLAGRQKVGRLDGQSLHAGNEDLMRPTSVGGTDRSLVMRAPTPVGVTHARMTPTVRCDSRRDVRR